MHWSRDFVAWSKDFVACRNPCKVTTPTYLGLQNSVAQISNFSEVNRALKIKVY